MMAHTAEHIRQGVSSGAARPLVLDKVCHVLNEGNGEKAVLAPLSRTFAAGQFHVVGGPSGAGKTTLLSILSLAVRPSRGMVLWGDDNLSGLRPAQQAAWRRSHLGLVFQTSRLVGVMTVREHVRLAAAIRGRADAEAEGLAILGALGMGARLNQCPAQLSGGEKQRVAIAQALCARPAVLLADEPTAALDQTNAALVAYTLRTFAKENSAVVICVSHDRVVIDAADQLLMLEKA
jgi:ABC-type lipoprotein export system ATPase subunit